MKERSGANVHQSGTPILNMAGLEWRWVTHEAAEYGGRNYCYLIEACNPARQIDLYRDILLETDAIFGPPELRNPSFPSPAEIAGDRAENAGTLWEAAEQLLSHRAAENHARAVNKQQTK